MLVIITINILAKHDSYAVDIAYTKFSNSIRLIGRLPFNYRTATDYFSVISVDILDPLKQVDAACVSTVCNQVNRGVVAPHHRVCLVAEIPRKPQNITVELCGRLNVRNCNTGAP